ncbi:hypothetical protein Tsubulata_035792 [Turnera subulata]|uniref:Uncharacterized protein n=1 Tax=Turnera subulata TaxID=218843 RepID=A0A9Q0FG80_9ROSI|nr:hypothetical protein Tsubulata_035792 [Turnera subulata]
MATLVLLQALAAINIIITICTIAIAEPLPKFSAILVFGDSTVDTGNNNYLNTAFKGNHQPYGQDFPNHIPTGRFSNGKLLPDFAASFLGIKDTVPPFLDPALSDDDIRNGVCFASAGSGYDNLTAAAAGIMSISKQLEMFRNYITRLKGIVGEEEGSRIIEGAFIIVSAGTNDIIDNYYDAPTRRQQFNNIGGYHDFLLNILQNSVKELYNLGGRSIAIAGLPPIGCVPFQRTVNFKQPSDPSCISEENTDSQSYNEKLKGLITNLQKSLPGSRIVYANIYDPLMGMINHPQNYGFTEIHRGCCGTGLVELATLCHSATPTCGRASQFLFWDAIHPTEAAYKYIFDTLIKQVLPQFHSRRS